MPTAINRAFVLFEFMRIFPPEIIGADRIITAFFAVDPYRRGDGDLVAAAAHQPVAAHDPARNGTVLFDRFHAVGRTARVHGAPIPVGPGKVFLEKPYRRRAPGAWGRIHCGGFRGNRTAREASRRHADEPIPSQVHKAGTIPQTDSIPDARMDFLAKSFIPLLPTRKRC